jgi:outer membrane protein assembly factor BamB
MLYIQASGCKCPSPFRANIAMVPRASGAQAAREDRLVKGSAYGRDIPGQSDAPIWAGWRADTERSGRIEGKANLPLRKLWAAKLSAVPTRLAAGYGSVFCGTAVGEVLALDAATGNRRWRYRAEGRIPTAPFLWQGRLYVGDDEGWVYSLRADSGEPVWRFRAALVEERVVGYGRYVSLWPVASGVLVRDGTAYFAAGLLPDEGTIVHAVDARTGKAIWEKVVGLNVKKKSFMRSFTPGGAMAMGEKRLFLPTPHGQPWTLDTGGPDHDISPASKLSTRGRRGGPELMVVDDNLVSPAHLFRGVWHVKYVEERSGQRLPLVTRDAIYMANQILGRKSGGVCLAALKRSAYEFNPKYGPVLARKKGAKDYVLWKAWQGVPMTVLIKVGDAVFSAGADKVYAAGAGDGEELWNAPLPARATDLAFQGGRLFVLCGSNEVVCFGN